MKKIILLSVLLLSACGYDMDVAAWDMASKACESHGSTVLEASRRLDYANFRCMNGYQGSVRRNY
jgi:hypothetical protein